MHDPIVDLALRVLENRMHYKSQHKDHQFSTPKEAQQYFKLKLAEQEREVFAVLYLDTRHRMLAYEELFHGTVDGASVYTREIVKAALKHNAGAVILAHNHPSGDPEPSSADEAITKRIMEALDLVGVRVLDHIVVGESVYSFAEKGDI